MKDIVKLTRYEIEDAIIDYIGRQRGQSFFPYRIAKTVGLTVYGEVTVELEMIPKGSKTSERKVSI